MSIGKRLNLGFLAVCSLILIVGLLGLILSTQVRGLRNVELPMEQNLREVEVSIWETIHAANAFRLTGLPFYEELYHKQLADVNEFFPKYEALADTEDEKIYIREFNVLWNEAKTAGDKTIALKREQEEQEGFFFEAVDGADEVIDSDIQAKWSPDDPLHLAKGEALREVEVSIWEAIHAAHQHVGLSGEVHEFRDLYAGGTKETDFAKLMTKQFGDLDEFLAKYKALATTRGERAAIARFEGFWKQAVGAGNEMLRLHGEADGQFKILYEKVDKADDAIDYKMQVYIQKRIEGEDLTAGRIRNITIAVVLFSLFFAVVISMRISRSIARPIGKLKDAADEIGKGRLDVIVEVESKDEIGDLAAAFNSMAALRKAAEEEARESGDRFRKLFENSNDAIFIHTVDGRILNANSKAENMMGYPEAVLKTMPVTALHPPEELETSKKAFEETISKGFTKFESRFLHSGGGLIDVEISARIVDRENGIIQGIVRDITERKKAEEALRSAHKELLKNSGRLETFQQVAVNREMRMVEMKDEVNGLLERLGEPRKYAEVDSIKKK